MGIALNLYIAFGKMAIFTILILPIQGVGRFFHFLRSASISFFRAMKFFSHRSFTCLIRVTQRYFILFLAIVKGVISLISFSVCLSFEYTLQTIPQNRNRRNTTQLILQSHNYADTKTTQRSNNERELQVSEEGNQRRPQKMEKSAILVDWQK